MSSKPIANNTRPDAFPTAATGQEARAAMLKDGFCLVGPIIEPDLVARASEHMDAVIAGDYETGVAPARMWDLGDDPTKLVKIDLSQRADRTILELISHPAIGEWAAAVMDAQMVQVWATQLLFKPSGGARAGTVGWHRDDAYWKAWMAGEAFTVWVALSEVRPESGPMRFVVGSHRWDLQDDLQHFFDSDMEAIRSSVSLPGGAVWAEAQAVMPAGAASFHHRLTIHGSSPNISSLPRRSFAIHLRTERSRVVPGAPEGYPEILDDPEQCPIIFRR